MSWLRPQIWERIHGSFLRDNKYDGEKLPDGSSDVELIKFRADR